MDKVIDRALRNESSANLKLCLYCLVATHRHSFFSSSLILHAFLFRRNDQVEDNFNHLIDFENLIDIQVQCLTSPRTKLPFYFYIYIEREREVRRRMFKCTLMHINRREHRSLNY